MVTKTDAVRFRIFFHTGNMKFSGSWLNKSVTLLTVFSFFWEKKWFFYHTLGIYIEYVFFSEQRCASLKSNCL